MNSGGILIPLRNSVRLLGFDLLFIIIFYLLIFFVVEYGVYG